MTLVRRCFSPLSIPQFRSMAEDVRTTFSRPIPSSSQSNMRLPTEIVTNVSDHGCNGPEKTDNPGRALDACSCQRNVAQSTFDTRTLCDALVVDNSLLDIFETHLSHLCDVRVPASSWLSDFVPSEQRVFWMTVVAFSRFEETTQWYDRGLGKIWQCPDIQRFDCLSRSV